MRAAVVAVALVAAVEQLQSLAMAHQSTQVAPISLLLHLLSQAVGTVVVMVVVPDWAVAVRLVGLLPAATMAVFLEADLAMAVSAVA